MGEIVNLRLERKRKQRELLQAEAAQNRIAFGTSKAERHLMEKERAKAERDLDARRLTGPDADPDAE